MSNAPWATVERPRAPRPGRPWAVWVEPNEVAGAVRRAAAGDRDAWDAIVRSFSGLVWTVANGHRLRPGRHRRGRADHLAAAAGEPGPHPRAGAPGRLAGHDGAPRVAADAAAARARGAHRRRGRVRPRALGRPDAGGGGARPRPRPPALARVQPAARPLPQAAAPGGRAAAAVRGGGGDHGHAGRQHRTDPGRAASTGCAGCSSTAATAPWWPEMADETTDGLGATLDPTTRSSPSWPACWAGSSAPPPEVVEAAKGLFTWRTVDAELADARPTTRWSTPAEPGVRAAGQPRILTFEAGGLTVEVEVDDVPGARRLIGQLTPPGRAELELRTSGRRGDRRGRRAGPVRAGPAGRQAALQPADPPRRGRHRDGLGAALAPGTQQRLSCRWADESRVGPRAGQDPDAPAVVLVDGAAPLRSARRARLGGSSAGSSLTAGRAPR